MRQGDLKIIHRLNGNGMFLCYNYTAVMYDQSITSKVKLLRKKGLTFNEIRDEFPFLSKSAISYWVRDISLTPSQKQRIISKQLKGRTALMKYNEVRKDDARRNSELVIKKASKEIHKISRRDLLIAGAALYCAEGYTKSKYIIEVANSNPLIISFMMRFFREILHIEEKKFRCVLVLHPGLNVKRAISFWSSLTAIPENQFHKSYIKPPKSSTGKMHNILYNGTAKIRVCDVRKLWQLRGYFGALLGSMAPSSSPV